MNFKRLTSRYIRGVNEDAQWSPPKVPWYKLNVNGAKFESSRSSGIGVCGIYLASDIWGSGRTRVAGVGGRGGMVHVVQAGMRFGWESQGSRVGQFCS
nr:hypothetical protein CFP56_23127 [Quercus suber]